MKQYHIVNGFWSGVITESDDLLHGHVRKPIPDETKNYAWSSNKWIEVPEVTSLEPNTNCVEYKRIQLAEKFEDLPDEVYEAYISPRRDIIDALDSERYQVAINIANKVSVSPDLEYKKTEIVQLLTEIKEVGK